MIKTQVLLAVHVLADETLVMWGLQFKIGGATSWWRSTFLLSRGRVPSTGGSGSREMNSVRVGAFDTLPLPKSTTALLA